MINATLKSLAKKASISESQVVEILAEEILLVKHYKNLVNFDAKFTANASKIVSKVAKVLKVSKSAVVSVMLQSYLKAQGK